MGTVKTRPVANTRAGRALRLIRIRELAAQGLSITQIANDVGLGEQRLRIIVIRERIDVPADRVLRKSRRLSSPRILDRTCSEAEHVTADVRLIDLADLTAGQIREAVRRLRKARRALTRFVIQLRSAERHAKHGIREPAGPTGPTAASSV